MDYELNYTGKEPRELVIQNTPSVSLEKTASFGLPSEGWANKLILGDNLPVLKTLYADPSICGQVRLVYIDPPFSTEQVFEARKFWYRPEITDVGGQFAYEDDLANATYLEFLRKRLIFIHELLAPDGSIYVHLDGNMVFAVKVIMDEIFGLGNFRSFITRRKCNPKNYTRNVYGNVSDFILFYTKTSKYVWHRPFERWDEERVRREYPKVEKSTGRRYKLVPIHAPGIRHGATGTPWHGMMPPEGKHWQYIPEKLEEFEKRGEIYWSPTGNPRRKVYFDKSQGIPMQDIWLGFRDAHNQMIPITGYPTEKNLDMLRLIVATSSYEDDLVLDCFAGSGVTLIAAAELNRRWIGIDSSELACSVAAKRLSRLSIDEENSLQGKFNLGDAISSKAKHYRAFELMKSSEVARPPSIKGARKLIRG